MRRSERADARDEHDERERLGEVVVGAGVERLGLVVLAVLRGEHEYRRPVARLAELVADLVAVDARQHDVEHDRVVLVLGGHPEPIGAGECDVDGEALGFEAAPHRGGNLLLVFHDQNAHARRGQPRAQILNAV